MDNYPEEFTDLQKRPSDESAEQIADCCDKLFELFVLFAESPKRKAPVWPLQIMLLVLCPVTLSVIPFHYFSIERHWIGCGILQAFLLYPENP